MCAEYKYANSAEALNITFCRNRVHFLSGSALSMLFTLTILNCRLSSENSDWFAMVLSASRAVVCNQPDS